jgi:zinc protease
VIVDPAQVRSPQASALELRVRRVPGAPVVAVRVWIRGGSRREEVPGQAYVTGRLLVEGSRRRGWREIAEDSERLGMAISSFGAGDVHGLAVDALADDWERALAWAAELALEPAFPPERVRWIARHAAGELESLADQPDVVAGWGFLEQLYAPHPRGRPVQGDRESLERLTPEACARFHQRGLAEGAVVTVAGEIDERRVADQVRELFGALPEPAAPPPVPAIAGLPLPHRTVESGGDQAQLYVGHLTVPRAHPDHPALQLVGVVLGAGPGLSGRIPTRIREREGLAYASSAQATAGAGLDPGRLVAYVGTAPENVAQAEAAVREELALLVERGLTGSELDDARAYLLGREPFRRETARQWAELLAEAALYELPLDQPGWIEERLRELDEEAVMAAARRHVRPADLKVTVGVP